MFKSVMKKVLWVFAIAFVLFLAYNIYFIFGSYSEGDRTGTIIKLSKKGYVFKTWEGQLNLEFFPGSGKNSTTSNIWDFSVANQQVVELINQAMDESRRVKLHYDEKYYRLPWRGETKYMVTKAELLQKVN